MLQKKEDQEIYDICVIGGGSAGLSVAAGAAQLGLKTVLIEKDKMGGDCLNTGCVPSKALLQAAKVAQNFRKAHDFGIKDIEPEIYFSVVKDHVFGVIAAIEPNDSQERFEKLGVTVIRDKAIFTGADTVIAGEKTILARRFVIATGSRAAVPPIPGLERDKVLTNENIFELRQKPDHLVIIGGGPIGIEMAQAHRRLGSKVTVLDMATILPKDDPELVAILKDRLKGEGIEIHEKTKIEKVEHSTGKTTVFVEHDGKKLEISGSHLLVAAGRQPNTEGLDLEKAGVEFDKRGIKTDSRLRSTNKNIYAAGDVAGGPQFTHIAGYHAGIIIRNVAFKLPAKVDYAALPWVTYTDPELANVGMTEAMAIEKFDKEKVKTVSWRFAENDRAQADKRTEGMIKVIALKNGKILGATILGPGAGDMLGIWGLAIQKKMKLSDIAGTIAPYPTLGEISKRVAGSWYTPKLFSKKTRVLVSFLQKLPFLAAFIALLTIAAPAEEAWAEGVAKNAGTIVLAGGCFWCMESDFDKAPGVLSTVSGYAGGTISNPTYENYHDSGKNVVPHVEAIRVTYDPAVTSYGTLLEYYFRHIDPTDGAGQFCDRGPSYRPVIFVSDDKEREIAENLKDKVAQEIRHAVAVEILQTGSFWPAEEHHQKYYTKNPGRYAIYRWNCGRDARIKNVWNRAAP